MEYIDITENIMKARVKVQKEANYYINRKWKTNKWLKNVIKQDAQLNPNLFIVKPKQS